MTAQVEAGLWVRNGGQVVQAVAAYRAVQPEEARDLDLLLLQFWLASCSADRCAGRVYVFRVHGFVIQGVSQPPGGPDHTPGGREGGARHTGCYCPLADPS